MKRVVPRLEAKLALLQHRWRAAFEFRHESWFTDDVYAALRSCDAALVHAEDDDQASPLEPTASWGYLRLRRMSYTPEGLAERAARVRAQPWSEAFVFFK